MSEKEGSITSAFFWMLGLNILLFWMPVVGPFIAGFVGGRNAGGVKNAFIAALLPAIIIGIFIAVFGSAITGMPVLGSMFGPFATIIAAIDSLILLSGAMIGAGI
ncbi:MAG: hypothetical protein MUP58_01210 [Candidatus Nanohaloarchaeota archaeon QJJ-9]|nr:hypothetical protein [Candidatus Nanohaloarchaeota archaeon QJJ-9]